MSMTYSEVVSSPRSRPAKSIQRQDPSLKEILLLLWQDHSLRLLYLRSSIPQTHRLITMSTLLWVLRFLFPS
jgi:hypothetical protein